MSTQAATTYPGPAAVSASQARRGGAARKLHAAQLACTQGTRCHGAIRACYAHGAVEASFAAQAAVHEPGDGVQHSAAVSGSNDAGAARCEGAPFEQEGVQPQQGAAAPRHGAQSAGSSRC